MLALAITMVLIAGCAGTNGNGANRGPEPDAIPSGGQEERSRLSDPIKPVNWVFFKFNDAFHGWIMEPVSRGYGFVMPGLCRRGVRNFFQNLKFPVRVVNSILQADAQAAGVTFARFCTNTTVGVLGFGDPATHWLELEPRRKDFGQTLAVYGLGPGFYITWPLFGPSTVRGTCGTIVDKPLYPPTYVHGLTLYKRINSTSFHPDRYDKMKEAGPDPYTSIKEAYWERRQRFLKE